MQNEGETTRLWVRPSFLYLLVEQRTALPFMVPLWQMWISRLYICQEKPMNAIWMITGFCRDGGFMQKPLATRGRIEKRTKVPGKCPITCSQSCRALLATAGCEAAW